MNKIRFDANMDTNYVFHMLSVAKCGYDNAYGEFYRDLYPAEDLAVLKENEELLTVCGGEHCGFLYGTLVSEPACAKMPAKDYYAEIIKITDSGEIPEHFKPYAETARKISSVMIKHYDSYAENIWKNEQEKIKAYIPDVLKLFEESDFTEKAESLLGFELPADYFTATLVTSIEHGAEAIDISSEQDVFGISRSPIDSLYFIGHEFIIYLLLHALKDEKGFRELNTWDLTEGLAEYYLKKIMGDTRFFNEQQKTVEFYEKCENGATLSAAELYRMGLKASNK